MTDENLAHARAWIEPVLANWCDEWAVLTRAEFCDQLARVFAAGVRAKGETDAAAVDRWYAPGPDWHCGASEDLRAHAADIPPPPVAP